MKRMFTLLVTLTAAATAFGGSVITASNSGSWTTPSTWNLGRIPADGDTIVIPASRNIQVTTDQVLDNVIINLHGILDLTSSGKLTLNSASTIRVYSSGLIAGQGNGNQIRIGNTHVFKGDWPDVTGPSFADNTTGGGFASMSMLPVKFVNFNISNENESVKISWSTAYEKNNSHFKIQRSIDGMSWTTIVVIGAVDNSGSLNHYSYVDKKINAAVIYYRIEQVDEDGSATYTTIKSISGTKSFSPEIVARSNNDIIVSFSTVQSSVNIFIWSMNGQSLHHETFTHSAYVSLRLGNRVPGAYIVQVSDQNNSIVSKKIILN